MILLAGLAVWVVVAVLMGLCLGAAICSENDKLSPAPAADATREVMTSDVAAAATKQPEARAAA